MVKKCFIKKCKSLIYAVIEESASYIGPFDSTTSDIITFASAS